jgi:acetyl esterase/lipase
MIRITVRILLLVTLSVLSAAAQQEVSFPEDVGNKYWMQPDVVYGIENGHENKLDVWYPHKATTPLPAVIYIHGGGWIFGDKGGATLQLLPYMQMGWVAINVEYRMANVSKATAAVEDCRCALRWVVRHAKAYHIDPNRIVVTGHSAGGHLALTTGMLTEADGMDNNCASDGKEPEPHVAAIVNWFGPTDVGDLITGRHSKNYAKMWFGSLPNKEAIARSVSPLTYVRKTNPPIITIHGNADDVVPYDHAVRLHRALDKAGVPNELFTVKGGTHGQFKDEDNRKAYAAIRAFLAKYNLAPVQ